jgi:hypothetical protein
MSAAILTFPPRYPTERTPSPRHPASAEQEILPFLRTCAGGLEEQHERLEAIRLFLLDALGGCENSLDVVLGLVEGAISYEQFGNALELSRSDAWLLLRKGPFQEVRWAAVAEAVLAGAEHALTAVVIDPVTARIVPASAGHNRFAVAIPGFDLHLAEPTPAHLRTYLRTHAQHLLRTRQHALHVYGLVRGDGTSCLDLRLVALFHDLRPATTYARRQGRPEVIDLHEGTEIQRSTGRRAAA